LITGVQGTTLDIYINGVLGQSLASNVNVTTNNINIGRWQSGGRTLNGNVAQVLINDIALSQAEILQNFNATKAKYGYSSAPTVTTTAISSITGTTANSGGTVTATGGAAITAQGVCWSTTTAPTIANSKTTNGTTTPFTSSITGLTAGTTYYVRAYATNSVGTSYGNEISFTTTSTSTIVLSQIVYSQSSLWSTNTAATNAGMTNGIFAETAQTGTNSSPNEWIKMDLGTVANVTSVVVGSDFNSTLAGGWGKGWAENRDIQYSTDNVNWTTAFNTGTFTQGIKTFTVSFSARYIRIFSNNYIGLTEFYAN
jgi:hypothetical protein